MNHCSPRGGVSGEAFGQTNSALTVCEKTAESPWTADYKQQSESRGFIRRSACHDDSWFHCGTLQHGITYNNHLGSLPGLAQGLAQSIPVPAGTQGGLAERYSHTDARWIHCWNSLLPRDQGVLVYWWQRWRRSAFHSYTQAWTTSDPSIPNKEQWHVGGSCLLHEEGSPFTTDSWGPGVRGDINTPDTEPSKLEVYLSLRTFFAFVALFQPLQHDSKLPLGETDISLHRPEPDHRNLALPLLLPSFHLSRAGCTQLFVLRPEECAHCLSAAILNRLL